MAHLPYFNYKGYGEWACENLSYSQAVRIGDRIECAGQGGWDTVTGKMRENFSDEVDQAFANVDVNLKNAGGKGWSQVYRVNIYVTDFGEEAISHMVRNCKKWMPDHKPIVTMVGVTKLGFEGMRFEVEVVAHDQEGAKASAAVSTKK